MASTTGRWSGGRSSLRCEQVGDQCRHYVEGRAPHNDCLCPPPISVYSEYALGTSRKDKTPCSVPSKLRACARAQISETAYTHKFAANRHIAAQNAPSPFGVGQKNGLNLSEDPFIYFFGLHLNLGRNTG